MNKLGFSSRVIVAVASLALIGTYFLPIWFIYLIAPQYPEGLTMNIWLHQITGQVEIINGLNHYIGMKHIAADMFPEFSFLVYIDAAFILLGLIVAIVGKRKPLFYFLILLVLAGVAAMVDFYLWSYDYGHNLDPKAAIQVPGLYYQPPLIGHKTLLNFDAYSYPDLGGWLVVVVFAALAGVWFFEWRKSRKTTTTILVKKSSKQLVPALVALALFVASCSTEPEPFAYGKDVCDDCKMTIVEPGFGAQIITKKGRVFKFDDAHCAAQFLKAGKVKEEEISKTVFVNYADGKTFLDANSLFFAVSPKFKSPMNSNAAAFESQQAAEQKILELKEKDAEVKDWKTLRSVL